MRRKKDEVEKYLPGKTQVILKCDMSSWQKVYYQQVTDVGRVGLDSSKLLLSSDYVPVSLSRLLEVYCKDLLIYSYLKS